MATGKQIQNKQQVVSKYEQLKSALIKFRGNVDSGKKPSNDLKNRIVGLIANCGIKSFIRALKAVWPESKYKGIINKINDHRSLMKFLDNYDKLKSFHPKKTNAVAEKLELALGKDLTAFKNLVKSGKNPGDKLNSKILKDIKNLTDAGYDKSIVAAFKEVFKEAFDAKKMITNRDLLRFLYAYGKSVYPRLKKNGVEDKRKKHAIIEKTSPAVKQLETDLTAFKNLKDSRKKPNDILMAKILMGIRNLTKADLEESVSIINELFGANLPKNANTGDLTNFVLNYKNKENKSTYMSPEDLIFIRKQVIKLTDPNETPGKIEDNVKSLINFFKEKGYDPLKAINIIYGTCGTSSEKNNVYTFLTNVTRIIHTQKKKDLWESLSDAFTILFNRYYASEYGKWDASQINQGYNTTPAINDLVSFRKAYYFVRDIPKLVRERILATDIFLKRLIKSDTGIWTSYIRKHGYEINSKDPELILRTLEKIVYDPKFKTLKPDKSKSTPEEIKLVIGILNAKEIVGALLNNKQMNPKDRENKINEELKKLPSQSDVDVLIYKIEDDMKYLDIFFRNPYMIMNGQGYGAVKGAIGELSQMASEKVGVTHKLALLMAMSELKDQIKKMPKEFRYKYNKDGKITKQVWTYNDAVKNPEPFFSDLSRNLDYHYDFLYKLFLEVNASTSILGKGNGRVKSISKNIKNLIRDYRKYGVSDKYIVPAIESVFPRAALKTWDDKSSDSEKVSALTDGLALFLGKVSSTILPGSNAEYDALSGAALSETGVTDLRTVFQNAGPMQKYAMYIFTKEFMKEHGVKEITTTNIEKWLKNNTEDALRYYYAISLIAVTPGYYSMLVARNIAPYMMTVPADKVALVAKMISHTIIEYSRLGLFYKPRPKSDKCCLYTILTKYYPGLLGTLRTNAKDMHLDIWDLNTGTFRPFANMSDSGNQLNNQSSAVLNIYPHIYNYAGVGSSIASAIRGTNGIEITDPGFLSIQEQGGTFALLKDPYQIAEELKKHVLTLTQSMDTVRITLDIPYDKITDFYVSPPNILPLTEVEFGGGFDYNYSQTSGSNYSGQINIKGSTKGGARYVSGSVGYYSYMPTQYVNNYNNYLGGLGVQSSLIPEGNNAQYTVVYPLNSAGPQQLTQTPQAPISSGAESTSGTNWATMPSIGSIVPTHLFGDIQQYQQAANASGRTYGGSTKREGVMGFGASSFYYDKSTGRYLLNMDEMVDGGKNLSMYVLAHAEKDGNVYAHMFARVSGNWFVDAGTVKLNENQAATFFGMKKKEVYGTFFGVEGSTKKRTYGAYVTQVFGFENYYPIAGIGYANVSENSSIAISGKWKGINKSVGATSETNLKNSDGGRSRFYISTGYVLGGTVSNPAITQAQTSINNAESAINEAKGKGLDNTTEAENELKEANDAFANGDYKGAITLSTKAINSINSILGNNVVVKEPRTSFYSPSFLFIRGGYITELKKKYGASDSDVREVLAGVEAAIRVNTSGKDINGNKISKWKRFSSIVKTVFVLKNYLTRARVSINDMPLNNLILMAMAYSDLTENYSSTSFQVTSTTYSLDDKKLLQNISTGFFINRYLYYLKNAGKELGSVKFDWRVVAGFGLAAEHWGLKFNINATKAESIALANEINTIGMNNIYNITPSFEFTYSQDKKISGFTTPGWGLRIAGIFSVGTGGTYKTGFGALDFSYMWNDTGRKFEIFPYGIPTHVSNDNPQVIFPASIGIGARYSLTIGDKKENPVTWYLGGNLRYEYLRMYEKKSLDVKSLKGLEQFSSQIMVGRVEKVRESGKTNMSTFLFIMGLHTLLVRYKDDEGKYNMIKEKLAQMKFSKADISFIDNLTDTRSTRGKGLAYAFDFEITPEKDPKGLVRADIAFEKINSSTVKNSKIKIGGFAEYIFKDILHKLPNKSIGAGIVFSYDRNEDSWYLHIGSTVSVSKGLTGDNPWFVNFSVGASGKLIINKKSTN